MKKLYTLFVALFVATASFAQSSDLEIFHYNLDNGDTLKIQNPTVGRIVAWGFINHGPDALLGTDTITLRLSGVSAPNNQYKLILPAAGIPVHDTVNFVDTFFFNSGPANGTILNWCDSIWAKRGNSIIADPVIANNKECKSLYVKNTTVGVADLLSGKRRVDVQSLKVYPNPASTTVSFDHNFNFTEGTVYVRDLVGRVVYQEKLEKAYGTKQITVDVSNLQSGIYMVEMITNDTKHVGKVLIQK